MAAIAPEPHIDASFTLDAAQLAQRRAASARRVHTVQIPAIRACGFVMLCVLAVLQDLRNGQPFPQQHLLDLLTLNLVFAAASWVILRVTHGRTGRIDLSLVWMHLDVLVWLANLHHLEQAHLFFAYLLLMRVADQVGFGFWRAIYFNHVVVVAYLGYAVWLGVFEPAQAHWADRLPIAVIIYLLGTYLSFTGLVIERIRVRMRQSVRTARELVERLEQKTHALEQQAAQLDHARLQAEQANVAKSQFLAVISHEIRTPMNGILGTTELLLGSTLTAHQTHYAKTAYRSATALLALIDDVLDLSRIEAGKLTLHTSSVDLRLLVTEAVDLMATVARDKPVTLSCSIPPDLPPRMKADPVRLRQLLVNLLHNAVKFTERGSVRVEVDVTGEAPQGLRLRFAVRDTGIGIAPEQLESVFDAFTQADASSTRRHGGSGLGLAIVKELAKIMGGEVKVESTLGAGSNFSFEVMLETSVEVAASAEPVARGGEAGLSAHVLLVEDDAVNQMVVGEMLKRLGCTVDLVSDGAAAHAAALAVRYDLVLMDCHMPVMDGYEATRFIRTGEQARGTRMPIIALTADALAGDRERCLQCGMDDYLTKPISGAVLAAAVERWTGQRTPPQSQW
ncbi:hypothetical protein BH11PSE9_BH11PSE9_24780 [soil metagenome]